MTLTVKWSRSSHDITLYSHYLVLAHPVRTLVWVFLLFCRLRKLPRRRDGAKSQNLNTRNQKFRIHTVQTWDSHRFSMQAIQQCADCFALFHHFGEAPVFFVLGGMCIYVFVYLIIFTGTAEEDSLTVCRPALRWQWLVYTSKLTCEGSWHYSLENAIQIKLTWPPSSMCAKCEKYPFLLV